MKQVRCSCGRYAEWVGELSGEPECWELIYLRRTAGDGTVCWTLKYPGEKARHRKDEA